MGKEQIMEDAVRDLTELALQEHRETTAVLKVRVAKMIPIISQTAGIFMGFVSIFRFTASSPPVPVSSFTPRRRKISRTPRTMVIAE